MPDITSDEIKEQIEVLKRPHEEKWGFSQYNAMIERMVSTYLTMKSFETGAGL